MIRTTISRKTARTMGALLAAALLLAEAACGGGGYGGGGGTMAGYSAPTITTQPANITVTAGQMAMFSVVASGATSYQWMKNSVDIAGATMTAYTTPATTSADNNAQFAVRVSNAYGTVTSNHAILTVN